MHLHSAKTSVAKIIEEEKLLNQNQLETGLDLVVAIRSLGTQHLCALEPNI